MTELYEGATIVLTRSDTCHECRRRVDWLLTESPGRIRHWHAVEFGSLPYQPHTCPRRVQ